VVLHIGVTQVEDALIAGVVDGDRVLADLKKRSDCLRTSF